MSNRISDNDFEAALNEVIGPDDDVIVIYSAIWSFAHRFEGATEEAPARIFDIISSVIGEVRTVLFPTFTNQFVKSRRFDIVADESDCSGLLANYAMRQPGFRRTRQPIHSYIVRGPWADDVLARPCSTAWGDDSVIAWMGEVNARFCPLGLPWHFACSYYHRAEEILQVPYRYYKRFAGTLLEDGREIGSCEEVKYSYSLQEPAKFNHTIVQPRLQEMNAIRTCSSPLIPLQSADANSIYAVTSSLLEEDIYAYVENRDQVEAWVNDGKAEEIASLSEEERWPQP